MVSTLTMSKSSCSTTVLFLKKRQCWAKAVSGLSSVGLPAKTLRMLEHSEAFSALLVQKVSSS